MPLGSDDDFSDDDLAILAQHGITLDPQADEEAPLSSEQAGAPEAAKAEPEAEKQPAEQQADDDKPTGNVNAALRASRRAERRAREESERLKKELDELRSKAPAGRDEEEVDLTELETDFPAAATAIKKEREAREAAERRAAALEAKDKLQTTDFVPEAFPDAVQDAIDDVPQLLAWQNNPDQTAFVLAKAADAMLAAHPKWRDKPVAERFAEAVKRVKADLDEPATEAAKTATEIAQERIKATQRKTLNTLSDLGGSTPSDTRSNVDRYARMSDDEIFEDLARGG